MSAKKKCNSINNGKCGKPEQSIVSSALNKSEVMNGSKTVELTNKNAFSDITHKNSSGANNWTKFAKLSGHGKDQPTKKPITNKTQVEKLSNNFIPLTDKSQTIQSQFNFKTRIKDGCKVNVSKAVAEKDGLFIQSRSDSKPSVTKHIAMDCEMVGVEIGVNNNMLARISLVNSHGDCIYDKFVKPTEPVLDYRTRVSGVRPKDLEDATDFKIVQREVSDLLKGRILVGHALKNDLKVLYLSHPKHSIRDTSRFQKFREGRTPALKKLAKKYLGVTIQNGEHSSVQDALAAMQLYKMFKKEWESSIYSKKKQINKTEIKST